MPRPNNRGSRDPAASVPPVARGLDEISLNVHNLTNAKPNLGDIGYVGYAQYDTTGTIIPQVATLQPLTVLVQYKHNF